MTNDELLSKTISWLRFPLIVGVVFIHNEMTHINIQGEILEFKDVYWYTGLNTFFSNVLPRISVPLFFFISGFLFFYRSDFNKETYKRKLKSRVKTLLVPYLIWNFIGFLILLTQMHPRFTSLFPLLADYRIDITVFLQSFWSITLPMNENESSLPINGALWFIRDLMVACLLSPILYWLIKRMKHYLIILLGLAWFMALFPMLSNSQHTIFFFPLGAYFSINRINFVTLFQKAKSVPLLYILVAILDTIGFGGEYHIYIHHTGILLGLVAVITVISRLIERNKIRVNTFLSEGSFFVYAAHMLFISKFMKAILMILRPESPYLLICIYFFVPTATILICLGLYKVLKKYLPSVASILTGGR